MEEEPKELIVLGAIKNGIKKFDKIQKATQVDPKELDEILQKLEKKEFIKVEEKKGWLGNKIEIKSTERGDKEVDERVHELQTKWNQMSAVYKTGDKEKMKDMMESNRSFLPMMMFFGVMDMMMFSMMFSMMGSSMGDYVPAEDIPDGMDSGSDMDGGGMDDGGFDFDIGF
ncbi:hypothetical protein [Nitrosopumilus sp.]|uniref:hypothetical protein n=1 Tax=Nitrosopumilus sp. TaxID=2024843 RepID=UPI002630CEBE|nr:hypothetical protein [Nitrosopumilus sp.]